jgi:hypothetical protein
MISLISQRTIGSVWREYMAEQFEPTSSDSQYQPLSSTPAQPSMSREEALSLAEDAYIFGYPLVLMDMTRQVMTAVPSPMEEANAAPVNQFVHKSSFPDAAFTAVVSPNADTLYSSAWLDLSREPIVLSVPDMGTRYFMLPILDAWTNVFAAPGTRTTGQDARDFVIVGPNWQGDIPNHVSLIRAPTNMAWIIGRTYASSRADCEAVHVIQQQFRLTPLSHWGSAYEPPAQVPVASQVDGKTAPVEQVGHMDAATFFGRLCALLNPNPPSEADTPLLEQMAKLGIIPGQPFTLPRLDPDVAGALRESVPAAQTRIAASEHVVGRVMNGWLIPSQLGQYGTNYLKRAVVALVGLGANLPEDALYPLATLDSDGQPLSGQYRYVLHFAADRLPPVDGFWSLSMYNARQFFVENPLSRYNVGNRDPLRYNADGSLDLYLQANTPDPANEANWLPAPHDSFHVAVRLYWPKPEVVSGTWQPPAIKHIE